MHLVCVNGILKFKNSKRLQRISCAYNIPPNCTHECGFSDLIKRHTGKTSPIPFHKAFNLIIDGETYLQLAQVHGF